MSQLLASSQLRILPVVAQPAARSMPARVIAAVSEKEAAMSLKGKLVRFLLIFGIYFLIPLTVHARLITEDPRIPGFPRDPAFAGSLVLSLNETLPARYGDNSFAITVGGVQFSFQTRPNGFGGLFQCSGPVVGAPPCLLASYDQPIVMTINPPVLAVGIIGVSAECDAEATFVGSLGTEHGISPLPASGVPVFLGAADIGGISTVTLSDTCTAFAAWSEMRFVPGVVPGGHSDVAMSKTGGAATIGAAAPLNYNIGVANNGPDTAKSVVAVDILPLGVTVDATSPGATLNPSPPRPATSVKWSLGDLARGGNASLAVTLTTPPFETFSCEDTLLNIAVAETPTDPNLQHNVDFTATPFDKASRANEPEICNNGLDDNCNGFVDCNDSACSRTTVCNPAIAPAPGVGPGGGGGGAPPPVGSIGNCVVFSATDACCCDPSISSDACPYACGAPPVGGTTVTAMTSARPVDPNRKESDPPTNALGYGYAQAGQSIAYTIHYENIGTADAHDVRILDPLHPNLDETTLVINAGGVYDAGSRVIVWHDPLALPPHVPRSVSFSVKVKADVQPGTRVRNRGTIIFPDAASPRTDTRFVEHTIVDPHFPVVADLFVPGCTKTSPSSDQWRVKLINQGFGFAYNVTAEVVHPPASVRVSNPLVHFVHPNDSRPDVLATVMPLSTSLSEDTVSIIPIARGHESDGHDADEDDRGPQESRRDTQSGLCNLLTWRIRYTTSSGETLSKDVCPLAGDVLATDGCSAGLLCPCAGPTTGGTWKNHGAYVSCVASAVRKFEQAGPIAERQKDAILGAAAHSVCGGKAEERERREAEK